MLLKAVSAHGYRNLEAFLFGEPTYTTIEDLELLFWLILLTAVLLYFMYNHMVFASFSSSLARSRRVPTRLSQYLFIVLLGIIVNVSIQIVGVLLINGLLIVPAATAANLSANMRQFFRRSVVLALAVGLGGYWLSLDLTMPTSGGDRLRFGHSGTIVVLSVLIFALSMLTGPLTRLCKRSFAKRPPASTLHNPLPVPTMAKNEPRGVPPA